MIAAIMITGMFGISTLGSLFTSFTLNLSVAIAALYISSYFIGKWLDRMVNVKKRSPSLYSVIAMYAILLTGVISGSTVGFIEEGLDEISYSGILDPIEDYYFKPFFWVMLYGFLPTLLSGLLLGALITRNDKN